MDSPTIAKIPAGKGRITLALHGSKATFEELSSSYPLKLLSPNLHEHGVAIVYLLSYGGGLVCGDRVELDVNIKAGCVLLVLSQGNTKVFKTRPGHRLASVSADEAPSTTIQTITYNVASSSALFLLPDPVTCFRSASYTQNQTFRLNDESASVVILDWFTSGRKTVGEDWAFERYWSGNDVFIGRRRVAKDVMLLEGSEGNEDSGQNESRGTVKKRTLQEKLAPYSCYAMLLLLGPEVDTVVQELKRRYEVITVFKFKKPEDLLWSFSSITIPGKDIEQRKGAVVRVAGKETELVKTWLKDALKGLEAVVGVDVYRRAFA